MFFHIQFKKDCRHIFIANIALKQKRVTIFVRGPYWVSACDLWAIFIKPKKCNLVGCITVHNYWKTVEHNQVFFQKQFFKNIEHY